jgi:hypothetical protein
VTSEPRRVVRRRSTLAAAVVAVALSVSACLPPGADAPLPFPAWWSGTCDSGNYAGAYPLGASYRGVDVCGPRPGADRAPNRLVWFFPGAWGELEWQCVELSMRFMYLAYGVSPYGANGKDVVVNYTHAAGGGLSKVLNGVPGFRPAPGDVISFGPTPTSSAGHTGVVAVTTIDDNGNGSIRILSQNDTADGWRNIPVSNWWVDGEATGLGAVGGWLHKPTS